MFKLSEFIKVVCWQNFLRQYFFKHTLKAYRAN